MHLYDKVCSAELSQANKVWAAEKKRRRLSESCFSAHFVYTHAHAYACSALNSSVCNTSLAAPLKVLKLSIEAILKFPLTLLYRALAHR